MTKKLRSLKKHWQKPRGLIVGVALVIITILSAVVMVGLSNMLHNLTMTADYSYAAYISAWDCLSQADALDMSTISTGASCVAGSAIDFVNSTQLSTVCDDPGAVSTVLPLGVHCSCIAQVLQANANSYDISAVGVCNPYTSDRTGEGGYTVTINKAINNCESCAQLCPGGRAAAPASCGTSCGKVCNSCCKLGPNPPCSGTPLLCQNP